MKLFISGEIDAKVDDEYAEISKEIYLKIKNLERNDYGEAVEDIGIIPIIVALSPALEEAGFFKERKLVRKKSKEADIRIRIDIEKFEKANREEKKLLVIKNVVESIRVIGIKVKKGFDAKRLEQDILDLFDLSVEEIDRL